MEFSKQEYWRGLPYPISGDLPHPVIKPASLMSPALAGRFFITVLPGTLILREMHIKTTMRYHLTPVRMAIIKKSTNNNAGEDVEKKESPYSVGRNVNWHSHYGEQYGC